MSYSNITKNAYASALKKLLQQEPFEKVTVSQICEKYDLSRKNFYYHFRDKYDLVDWIFDEDCIALFKDGSDGRWESFEKLCNYFYENREFYRKVLTVEGQNSFSAHFEEFLYPLIQNRLQNIFGEKEVNSICVDFTTDGLICTIRRWLLSKDPVPAEKFVSTLKSLVENVAANYSGEENNL